MIRTLKIHIAIIEFNNETNDTEKIAQDLEKFLINHSIPLSFSITSDFIKPFKAQENKNDRPDQDGTEKNQVADK